jgi:hypothetical protein
MFHVELLSLGDGQSYEHVKVLENDDLEAYNVPMVFEEWTGCFFADNKCVVCHQYNISMMLYDKQQRSGPESVRVERLLLSGERSYAPALILPTAVWFYKYNIPYYFAKRFGFEGQMVFSCKEGTIMTADTNISSIIVPFPARRAMTRGIQPQPVGKLIKQAACPDVVHGKIRRRSR